MKVLVVEDNADMVELVSICLKGHWPDVKIIAVGTGKEGVVAVEAKTPDVVILDIGLPDIDDWQVLKRLREFSYVPVVVLTARSADEDLDAFLTGGAEVYLTKPFDIRALLESIERVLGYSKDRSSH